MPNEHIIHFDALFINEKGQPFTSREWVFAMEVEGIEKPTDIHYSLSQQARSMIVCKGGVSKISTEDILVLLCRWHRARALSTQKK